MEYWEPTQKALQGEFPIVKRPKLTDVLLRKPPFHFLHDVISEVCRQTGFAKGLYTTEELISTNIKDKEGKVMYLSKIIDCVCITLSASVLVSPSKIVVGLEPEQTNVFLQMLAAASMMDKEISDRAVASVLAGEKQPLPRQEGTQWIQLLKEMTSARMMQSTKTLQQSLETSQQHSIAKKQKSPTKGFSNQDKKLIEQQDESSKVLKKVLKSNSHGNRMSSKSPTKSSQPLEGQSVNLCENGSKPNRCQPQHQSLVTSINHRKSSKERSPTKRGHNKPTMGTSQDNQTTKVERSTSKKNDIDDTSTKNLIPHKLCGDVEQARSSIITPPYTGLVDNDNYENEAKLLFQNQGGIDALARTPPNQEPSPFSKGASTLEDNCLESATHCASTPTLVETIVSTLEPRPQSARKAPPTLRKSAQSARENYKKPNILLGNYLEDEDELENMHILVQPQSIQKEDVVHGDEHTSIILGPIRGSFVKKEYKQTKQEVQKLKEGVQALCQTMDPLGKSIDYLQEDMEMMSKEYNFWVKERDLHISKLEEERRVTKDMLLAQSGRLLELDEEMHQQSQQINMSKAQILHNDESIIKLLRMVTTRSTRWNSLSSGSEQSKDPTSNIYGN